MGIGVGGPVLGYVDENQIGLVTHEFRTVQ